MSGEERWLLPAGIEELLPDQADRLERLRRDLIDLYRGWGYELVVPPLIEFVDSLLIGTGDDLDLQTFKLTDQLTGRLMGVRADQTPQVARIDAHLLKRDVPTRLCYIGAVLHTRPDGFAGSRSPLQAGVELYGHHGAESDVEVLALMLETLHRAGVRAVHVDLGHVAIFRGLARQAGLAAEQEQALFDALQRKARPEIRALLEDLPLDTACRERLMALVDLNGGPEVLAEAELVLAGAAAPVDRGLAYLRRMMALLRDQLPGITPHFDLAELRGYHYHTGAVFAAFVPGHGQAIAQGGRYDNIGRVFGRARPATGFSVDLKTLVALAPSRPPARSGILAPWRQEPTLRDTVAALRASGERVVQALPGDDGGPEQLGCDRRLQLRGGVWTVVPARLEAATAG